MQEWLRGKSPVDGEDLERHDNWLCMMWPRLHLLRELLAEDGSAACPIPSSRAASTLWKPFQPTKAGSSTINQTFKASHPHLPVQISSPFDSVTLQMAEEERDFLGCRGGRIGPVDGVFLHVDAEFVP